MRSSFTLTQSRPNRPKLSDPAREGARLLAWIWSGKIEPALAWCGNGGIALGLQIERPWPAVPEHERYSRCHP